MPRPAGPIPILPPRLRVHLFGQFRIENGANSVRLPTRQIQLLLAYVVLHPEAHSREKLAGLLWGDVTDAQARHSLRTAINALRKCLGGRILFSDRETVQVSTSYPLWVDVHEFEKGVKGLAAAPPTHAEAVLNLYQGDLLPDFYDDWILPEREHYRQHYLDALLQLAYRMRALTEYAHAIELAHRVLVSDPANERGHQQLIFCYMAAGDRTAALKQYEECQRRLQEELAAEPSPETTALYEWIKQGQAGGKTREGLITNLPIPLTGLVGRKQELAQIGSLLSGATATRPTTRLLTLTGAGGSGKTRLAIQAGMDLLQGYKDGVWWVDMAPLFDEKIVPHAVAKALGVRERPNQPIVETLQSHLQSKQLLLLLDNCEHLLGACAELAQGLLTTCPQTRILATSREALGIGGETIWYVPTLSVPDPRQRLPLSDLCHYDGVQLFVERALAVRTDFALTEQNAPSVIQACAQLDGIPLAIELAAARLKALTVEQIAERLVDRFNLLTGGSRAALPRHRTLRATLDWSYGLLSREERLVFERLAAFAGGWTLTAAEAVCVSETIRRTRIIELLSELADKSLVVVQGGEFESRYRMLETVRQYAMARLEERGEREEVCHRHALYFAELAEKAEHGLRSSEMSAWLERLETDHDNMRAALDWSLAHESPETGLRFANAMGIFWRKRGYLREGLGWLEGLLARSKDSPPPLRAKALVPAGWLARDQGDYRRATRLQDESLEIFHAEGDKLGTIEVLIQRGIQAVYQNDLPSAFTCFGESLALSEQLGSRRERALSLLYLGHAALFSMHWDRQARAQCEQALEVFQAMDDATEQAHAHIILGAGAHFEGDDGLARNHLEEAASICRTAGDKRQLGWSTAVLSWIISCQGRRLEAWSVAKDALRLALELGDRTIAVNVIIFASLIAAGCGQAERAARLLACALTVGDTFGFQPTPHTRALVNPVLDAMRAALGPEVFAETWAAGQAMRLEQAVADILGADDEGGR